GRAPRAASLRAARACKPARPPSDTLAPRARGPLPPSGDEGGCPAPPGEAQEARRAMRTGFASATVVLLLAACSGERAGDPARTEANTSSVATVTAPQGGTGTQAGALPDVAPLGS